MHYVYVLKSSQDILLYAGYTSDPNQRISLHNAEKAISPKARKPLELIYYEAFMNKEDTFKREKRLKTGGGRNQLHQMISKYLES